MHTKTIYTFITLGMLAMVVMAGCSGSSSTTVIQGVSPVIQNLSVQGLPSPAGGSVTASVAAISAQGLGLTYTWTAYNGWSVSSGASMSIATIKAPDTYAASGTVTVQVSDTNGRYALVPIPVSTVGDNAPVITNLSASSNPAPRDGIIVVAVNATDPLGNALKYAWTGSAGWPVTGYGVTATVTAPNTYDTGGYVTVTVSDNYGMAVTASIAVSTIVDNPPVISDFNVSPNPVSKGGTAAISVTATDPYNNTLLYSWQASNGWTVATGQGTSAITVTAPTQYGVSGTVTVTVDDGYGGTASLPIPVSTIGNSAPVIDGISATPTPVVPNTMMGVAVTANDPDGDTLGYTWTVPTGWTLATGQGTSGISITAPDQPGDVGTVTVTVNDLHGDAVTGTIGVATLQIPSSPAGLSATSLYQAAKLTWTTSSGATGYNVYISTTTFNPSAEEIVSAPPYMVTGLGIGIPYYFTVTAFNGAGESGPSNQATATPINMITYPVDNSFPFYDTMVMDPSGNIWITQKSKTGSFGTTISEVTAASGYTVGRTITVGLSPFSIAIDSAGNIWVTNAAGNTISEVTAASGYTVGRTIPVGNTPLGIAIDASGNVWVTNTNANTISEVTFASGYNSGKTISCASSSLPESIAIDASGNVWVANTTANTISEMTFASGYTVGKTISVGSDPQGIAIDPSGNVWVANNGSNTLSEISSTGTPIETYEVGSGPSGIAIDASGNVWFRGGSNTLIKFNVALGITDGTYTVINPIGIAIDSAGNVLAAMGTTSTTQYLAEWPGIATGPQFFPCSYFTDTSCPQWPGSMN